MTMAFSFRKIFSNINYFKRSEDTDDSSGKLQNDPNLTKRRHTYVATNDNSLNFERFEADSSTSIKNLDVQELSTVEATDPKKYSLSDSDIILLKKQTARTKIRNRRLKLDIRKANKSMNEALNKSDDSSNNAENTPKHILLESEASQMLRERLKDFDFNKSLDIYDIMSDENISSSPFEEDEMESMSDTDISLVSDTEEIKMCRKVEQSDSQDGRSTSEFQLKPTISPDSFAVLDLEHNEEDRLSILTNYQIKLNNLESFLRSLLTEFKFHIETSKVFCSKSVLSLPSSEVAKFPKIIDDIKKMECLSRGVSPTGSWSIVLEKEDRQIKRKLRKQLLSIKKNIENFINIFLISEESDEVFKIKRPFSTSSTYDSVNKKKTQRRPKVSKKPKHSIEDLHEVMNKLFSLDSEKCSDIMDSPKCECCCHNECPSTENDSGLSKVNDGSISNQSVTSSIGNFSLDSITLSAYSESLDHVVSFNSYQDTSLYRTLLQKTATERITFYIQVHSIQIKCEPQDEYESKTSITFDCPACNNVLNEENSLLRHILSHDHCVKIHFLYKTAYIKKCVAKGKEIQPSTVLNPMTMYRDENKIVCFGDAMYACSLCFENLIVGESVLMAHCQDPEHVERRELMCLEMFE